jgi:hypothetical protein
VRASRAPAAPTSNSDASTVPPISRLIINMHSPL